MSKYSIIISQDGETIVEMETEVDGVTIDDVQKTVRIAFIRSVAGIGQGEEFTPDGLSDNMNIVGNNLNDPAMTILDKLSEEMSKDLKFLFTVKEI